MVKACGEPGLTAWDQVNCYCERAFNPDFWAEPLNALSNLAFIIAAVLAYADLRASGLDKGRRTMLLLILLLMCVGVGSFLFHTYATHWARFADIIPIAVFVAVYMALALNWFVGLALWASALIAGVVVAGTVAMFLFGSALNGSLAYAPALASMLIVGTILYRRRHGATDWILSAFCVFFVSLVLRTLDRWPEDAPLGCMVRQMGEQTVFLGTHPFWHIFNGVMLYLLLRAAIENPPLTRS